MGIRAPGSTKIWTKLAKLHQKKLWEIWSRFPFTRQITLKDEHLSQCFPDRKVLWMTLKSCLENFSLPELGLPPIGAI